MGKFGLFIIILFKKGKLCLPYLAIIILHLPVPLPLSHNRTSFSLLLLPLPLSHTYFCLSLSLLPLGSVTIFMMWMDLLIIHHIRSSTLLIYISAYLLHGSCSYIHETTKTYLVGPDKLYCNLWTALFRAYLLSSALSPTTSWFPRLALSLLFIQYSCPLFKSFTPKFFPIIYARNYSTGILWCQ